MSTPKPTTRPRVAATPTVGPSPLPTAAATPVVPSAVPSVTLPPGSPTPLPASPTAERAALTAPDVPIRLRIPAIHLDAQVESVGLSGDAMGVPANPWDVAWFNRGPLPGVVGNAVIDGHLDTATGSAVFLYLGDLRVGDLLYVTTAGGGEHVFKVTALADYPVDKAPLAHIFGASNAAHLNLITCGGDWIPQEQNYNERLVVYSTLSV